MNLTKTERTELQKILEKLSSEYLEERQFGYSLFITSTFVDKVSHELNKIDADLAYMCFNNPDVVINMGQHSLLHYVLSEFYKTNSSKYSNSFKREIQALISIFHSTSRCT